MAPTASHVGIWEASSNTTKSNLSWFTSIYCATDIGLISIHGHMRGNKLGIESNSLRIGTPRPLLRIHFCKIPTSELWAAAYTNDGMLEANFA